jgi:futalosine hydrolase
MIALLCSVQAEAELLTKKIDAARKIVPGSKAVIEGTVSGRDVLLCIGGMGKINAAHAATLLLSRYQPEALVIFGIGGAYPSSGARPGDVAVATEEIAGDEGVLTAEGFKDTEYMGIPLLKTDTALIFNAIPVSEPLLDHTFKKLASGRLRGRVRAGAFITLSTCTGTSARAKELELRYNGLCENMEGAAAALVAAYHNVPWLEVRGISNMVEDRNVKTWDIPKAAQAAQEAVIDILEGWER